MINVLLVDDHELVRTGIKRILDDVRGFKVVGEAKDGEQAVQFCRQHSPNIVLMDMNMPGMGGLEATKKICRYCPDVKIIVLTVNCEDPFPSKVMQIGAHGFLTKGAGSDEMVRAIRCVHAGQRYIAPEIAQQIALAQVTGRTDENPFQSLSERELQIMLMITKGEKAQDIAERLNLSSKTVNSYRYRMFEKLNVGGDVELTHLAIRHKMIDIDISY
ncbi:MULTISPECIES: UvrY/SirA/GacA family response regulator transcription factor [unclassified Pseudoalteromonas]|uniref:UvrY/SirA/GacA family response regulator transcription factor n=1 Tax=Pseudoalteromonas TaxID=53246 RepID=UPI0011F1E116|nr:MULTISPECIES: UvrY/SirA/GacA family response regulator transcription factor [unclassified Pseudoalteromonas]KAA1149806.1 two-component system response regulator UvrY [Pseudoalteromonas sp. FUC4]MBH0028865.1 UvrY/SirA/GacA family response regulator transcription factor [Pseudoalteromonas sp. SWN29]MBH0039369.1 UvrY/SirA/GacA family response regulator transcription factor [Pseudoalteromonas sp. SWN166]MBH0044394.1 UvrY/SirA/GacA family response regulator transcription factor [Pseudoalteromonas